MLKIGQYTGGQAPSCHRGEMDEGTDRKWIYGGEQPVCPSPQ